MKYDFSICSANSDLVSVKMYVNKLLFINPGHGNAVVVVGVQESSIIIGISSLFCMFHKHTHTHNALSLSIHTHILNPLSSRLVVDGCLCCCVFSVLSFFFFQLPLTQKKTKNDDETRFAAAIKSIRVAPRFPKY